VFDTGGRKVFDSVHQTNGIDVYVTGERTILLDSQVLAVMRHIYLYDVNSFTDVQCGLTSIGHIMTSYPFQPMRYSICCDQHVCKTVCLL